MAILYATAKRAAIGGAIAGGVVLIGQWAVGRVYSGAEARQLLDAFVPSARAVGTGSITASTTILALMLTMLSLSRHATSRLEEMFFERVERIGLLSTIGLAASVLLLLLLTVPLQESQKLPQAWYTYVYYALIGLVAGVAALLVATVLMLYSAMQSLIRVLGPSRGSASSRAPTQTSGSASQSERSTSDGQPRSSESAGRRN